jgi:hypothetical protein
MREIKDVSPMSAAFQKMIDECDTDYYIQVDEDMILYKDSIEIIYDLIKNSDFISLSVCMAILDSLYPSSVNISFNRFNFSAKFFILNLIRLFTDNIFADFLN